MSTRGAWGFVIDGVEKVTYNHFDSYPQSLGRTVLDFLRRASLDEVRESAAALRVVDPQSKPTPEDVERLLSLADTRVSTQSLDEWYVLLRKAQGEPLATLAAGVIVDGSSFPLESLWCEPTDAAFYAAYDQPEDEDERSEGEGS